MFVVKMYNFRVLLCFTILILITKCDIGQNGHHHHHQHRHRHRDRDRDDEPEEPHHRRHHTVRKDPKNYASCILDVWNTRDMKADKLPSIIAVTESRPDEGSELSISQFKINDQWLQIEFKHGEKLMIICHKGTVNYAETIIGCSNGVKVPGIEKIKDCEISEPKPEFKYRKIGKMEKTCGEGNDTYLYEIGYNVFPEYETEQHTLGDTKLMKHKFFPFIEVCMSRTRKTTSYTSHKIDGKVIAGRQITTSIPDKFSMEKYNKIDNKFKPDNEKHNLRKKYNPQKQFHLLYKTFGDKLRDYFDNEESNFVPRQLTPDYDMLLKNYKTLTHYYINTAPQWKILSCTWDALEELIRERVSKRGYEVTVYTGTYGILSLDEKEVYISPKDELPVPVPKYFWKIVLHRREEDYAAIGFITSNNPYDTEREPFCKSICSTFGWPIEVKTPGLGKTICCKVKELLRKIGIAIPLKSVRSGRDIDLSNIKEVLTIPAI